jgi:hypothetical protein
MYSLNDAALIDAYVIANDLQLDDDFIVMLEREIRRRGIQGKVKKVRFK